MANSLALQVAQLLHCTNEVSFDGYENRASLVVDALTADRIPSELVSVVTDSYRTEDVNIMDNPMFGNIQNLYAHLPPHSRVEVVVYDENDHLQQVIVDKPLNDTRRIVSNTRKSMNAYANLEAAADRFANEISIPPLTYADKLLMESCLDRRILETTLENNHVVNIRR